MYKHFTNETHMIPINCVTGYGHSTYSPRAHTHAHGHTARPNAKHKLQETMCTMRQQAEANEPLQETEERHKTDKYIA